MKVRVKSLIEKIRKIPKRKLIAISISIKVIEVAVSTYILKKFFLN
ncbi:hypothetical protein [Thermovibrio guaymasensis]|nr:hypothetical protein [Thermovibrio guaymasensis]